MKMLRALFFLLLALPGAALAQDPVRIVVDLGNKEVTITNTLAIRERIPVLVVNIGSSQPSNMVARITSNDSTVMCYSASFTNSGTNAVGVLDLNTSELVALFSNSSPQSVKALNFGLWDTAQARLLVNTKVSLQNNPYLDGMAGPSPVGTVYLEGQWGPHTNAWQAGLVVQTGANEGEYFRRLPSELTAMVTNLMWGNLVGSITNQADLIALLDALAAGTTNEAALRALADIALQSNLTAAVTSLTALIQTNAVTNAYSMAQADAKFATGMPVYVESDPLWRAASNAYYTAAQADDRFATTNGLAILSLKHADATNKLETVFGWGNHATNGYIKSVSGWSGHNATQNVNMAAHQLQNVSKILGETGFAIDMEDGSVEGEMTFLSNVLFLSGETRYYGRILLYDSQTNAVVSITATGGVQVGSASFHAETSGDIWHDPTNSAVLGILSASIIKNTNGTPVLYSGESPTISQWATATQRLAAVDATNLWLWTQVTQLFASASTSWASAVAGLASADLTLSNAMTTAVASASVSWTSTTASLSATDTWLFVQITNRDHTVTTGLQASIAANLSTFASFTNGYASAITNVDAVAFGGSIKSAFMLAADWEDIRTNVVFGFLDTVATTNSAGAINYLKYDGGTNTWLHNGAAWKWWPRYGF